MSVVISTELGLITWWSLSFSSQMIFSTSLLLSFFTVCTSAEVDKCCSQKHKHKKGFVSMCPADTLLITWASGEIKLPGQDFVCPDGSWNLQTERKAEGGSGRLISCKLITLSGTHRGCSHTLYPHLLFSLQINIFMYIVCRINKKAQRVEHLF